MGKILIADHYRGSLEQMRRALEQGGKLSGISMLTLSSFKESEEMPREAVNLSFHQKLMKRQSEFEIYGGMFRFPSFINEILMFAGECVLYGIGAEDLPEDNNSEKELRQIVALALEEELPEKRSLRMAQGLKERLQTLKEKNEVSWIPSFASDVFSAKVNQIIAESVTEEKEERNEPVMVRRYADSDHQELEAIVQDIIGRLNQNPSFRSNIILTNAGVQMPVLDQVMHQYGMHYSAVHQVSQLPLFQRWCALADLALDMNDMEKFLNAVSVNAFDVMPSGSALAFMHTSLSSYVLDTSLPERMKQTCFSAYSEEIRRGMEETQKYLDLIEDKRKALKQAESAQDQAVAAYEIVRHASVLEKHEEKAMQEGAQLRRILSNCLGYMETEDDLAYLIEIIRDKCGSGMDLSCDSVIVTDLRHPVSRADMTYVAGCCEDYYPGFSIRNGLFDEAYVKKVDKYPGMEERLDLYNRELEWVKYSGNQIVYSMASTDTDGRERNWYVGLTAIADQKKWELKQLKPMAVDPGFIDRDDVQNEFMQEGTITTSVTASEDFFKCAMQWFYKHGMKIDQRTPLGLDAAAMGTLWHQMMEAALKESDDPKQYCEKDETWIRGFLEPQFDVLRQLLPGQVTEVNLTEEKMVQNALKLFAWLRDMEGNTSYVPSEAELAFDGVAVTQDEKVKLRGRIDRVDEFGGHEFRIIDYKSGADKYSPTEFAKGLQTQLISYLLVYEKLCEQQGRSVHAAGGWYCHLNPQPADAIGAETAGRGKKAEVVLRSFDEETCWQEEYHNRRMPGVTLDDEQADGLDSTGGTYSALNSHLPAGSEYMSMEDMLDHIYHLFYRGVISGVFRADPVEGACTFCHFKGICRFKGRERKAENLLEVK